MTNLLKLSSIALALVLATSAAQSLTQPGHRHHDAGCTPTLGDPDPADCPFCGGNPQVHIKKMFEMQRVTMGLATQLLR